MNLSFFVKGEPKAQPRPKAMRMGKGIRIYTPDTAKAWKEAVIASFLAIPVEMRKQAPKGIPLSISLQFHMPRPKSHLLKSGELSTRAPLSHVSRPDTDNLAKAVLDALQGDSGAYHEDSQITELSVSKQYAKDGHAGVNIFIREINY